VYLLLRVEWDFPILAVVFSIFLGPESKIEITQQKQWQNGT
jgi:hypothetical protein